MPERDNSPCSLASAVDSVADVEGPAVEAEGPAAPERTGKKDVEFRLPTKATYKSKC